MKIITTIKFVETVSKHLYETVREWAASDGIEESKKSLCTFAVENNVNPDGIILSKTTVDIVVEEDTQ